MSSIVTDKRGKKYRYHVKYKDPRTGNWRTKAAGPRRKDAAALMVRMDSEIASGTFEKYEDIGFTEFAQKWLEESVSLRLKQTTIADYRQIVKNHLDPFFGKYLLKSISIRLVQEYIGRKTNQAISPRTVSKTVTALHTIFAYAVRLEYVRDNPVRYAVRPRQTKKEFAYLDQEQIRRFLAAASPEYFPFFATAVLTGARQGELIALRWRDVDLARRVIRIEHSYNRLNKEAEPKTKGSRRAILISDELAGILTTRLERSGGEPDELVFPNRAGNHISGQNMMTREFYPALERAGLPRIRFHDLRHTYAAVLITMGEKHQVHPETARTRLSDDYNGHLRSSIAGGLA